VFAAAARAGPDNVAAASSAAALAAASGSDGVTHAVELSGSSDVTADRMKRQRHMSESLSPTVETPAAARILRRFAEDKDFSDMRIEAPTSRSARE